MSYEGTVVLNYRLANKLGEGGFGTVYLAEHTELGRKAACKILHREFAGKPEVVERFFREAKSVCAIGHRAIIDIENFGTLPGGEPFYLMEFFPGTSLADHFARTTMTPAQLFTIFDAVASALTAAHRKQIIHRDLKPENIMVLAADDGSISDVKLLDFGIAKLVGDADAGRSRSGMQMGTPSYMAPEQALDAKSVDARADVYAFGATVYAAIAGRPPYVADSAAGVLLRAQTDPPTPLAELVPTAPIELARALEHCLAKRPAERPASITEAWREIRQALGNAAPIAFARAVAPASGIAATLAPDAQTVYPAAPPDAPATVVAPATVGAPATVVAPATVALRKQSASATSGAAAASAIAAGAHPSAPGSTTLGAAASQSTPLPAPSRSRALRIAVPLVAIALVVVAVVIATQRKSSTAASITPAASGASSLAQDAPAVEPTVPDAVVAELDALALDAAIEVVANDAGPKPPARPKPDAGVKPPIDAPPAPALNCSVASFRAVYQKASPSEDELRSALDRLSKCRGQLSPEQFQQVQQNLVSKL